MDTHSTDDDHWHFETATVHTELMKCLCFIVAVWTGPGSDSWICVSILGRLAEKTHDLQYIDHGHYAPDLDLLFRMVIDRLMW